MLNDAAQAMKVLTSQNPPAIVLVDAQLPPMSGLELAADVRRRAGKMGPRSPAWMMLMCDQVDGETVASAIEAGIDDLLLKPVDISDLRVRLRVAERVQALTRSWTSRQGRCGFMPRMTA